MVYFDNAATTKPCILAIDAVKNCLFDNFGNASSFHKLGVNAEKILHETRKNISQTLSCKNVVFASGATECNNLAIFSAAGQRKNSKKIITSTVEHPSIAEPIRQLEQKGYEIVRVSPRDIEKIPDFADENTCLVSLMLVNNENGAIFPVQEIFLKTKAVFPKIITHCDCVQGYMKLPINSQKLQADFCTVSGHKIGGIKGVGALCYSENVRILPQIFGGGQEKNLRSGTENIPAIAAFNAAIISAENWNFAYIEKLKNTLLENINKSYTTINSPVNSSPYIVNISIKNIKSEVLLHFLEEKDIYVSSGSACSKGKKSRVLAEFGVENPDNALRISFSLDNTIQEVEILITAIDKAYKKIIHT